MSRSTIFWAIFACTLWGSAFAVANIGFGYMPPILLSGLRFMLAGLLLTPMLIIQKVKVLETIRQHWRFLSTFAVVQTMLQYGLFFMGLDRVPAAISAIITGAGPLFIAVMAHITMKDDHLTPRKLLAIAIGIAGVLFISIQKGATIPSSLSFYIGVGLLIISSLIGSYTNIMVAKYKAVLSPILLTSYANFFGGVMLTLIGLGVEELPTTPAPASFYGALVWLATISATSFSIWYTLLQRPEVKVSELNMWKFIIPVTGTLLSWLILPNESPDTISIIGIVVITIALQIFQRKPKARS